MLLLQWALFLAVVGGAKRGDDFLKVTQLQVASRAPIPAAHMDGAPPMCPAVTQSTGGMLATLPGRQHYQLILQTKKLRHREVKVFAQSHSSIFLTLRPHSFCTEMELVSSAENPKP